jgi:hypothetical protein
MLGWVFRGVFLEQTIPLLLLRSALSGMLTVEVIHFLGYDETLLGIKAETLLHVFAVISLERISMYPASSLEFRAIANCRSHLDYGWLVSHFFRLLNCGFDACQIMVTILNPLGVPPICFESLQDILGESQFGVTI